MLFFAPRFLSRFSAGCLAVKREKQEGRKRRRRRRREIGRRVQENRELIEGKSGTINVSFDIIIIIKKKKKKKRAIIMMTSAIIKDWRDQSASSSLI